MEFSIFDLLLSYQLKHDKCDLLRETISTKDVEQQKQQLTAMLSEDGKTILKALLHSVHCHFEEIHYYDGRDFFNQGLKFGIDLQETFIQLEP